MAETILVTGAAGNIGVVLRTTLRKPERHLRLLDRLEQEELPFDDADLIHGSFLDAATMDDACRGVTAVIHLGGLSTSGYTWDEYGEVNVNGTLAVLEAARRARVPRVIFASSHHVAGFHPSNDGPVPDYLFARPDSLYGVSKAAGEALCSLYHDRFGIETICLRIGSYLVKPNDKRSRWSWLSPGDCTRLFDAALSVESPGFRVVWGVSKNGQGILSLDEGQAIGYFPQDDAETYVAEITEPEPSDPLVRDRLGGPYAALDES